MNWDYKGKVNKDVIKMLIKDRRVDPIANNNRGIKLSCTCGYTEIVKLLLTDRRVSVQLGKNNDVILLAIEKGHAKVVQMLLKDPRVDSSANNYAITLAR
jgi:hypothetical protein